MRISTLWYTFKQGFKNIFRNKIFSLATIATISSCIFLFGLFYCLVINVQYSVKAAQSGVAVTVFFDETLDADQIQQIGAQIEHNEIDLMIFLRDPLAPDMHKPDINYIVKLCDMHNIPLATNLATAELLIKSLDRGDMEWREMYK